MTVKRKSVPQYAVCVKNKGYEVSLERNKIYRLVPDPEAEGEGDVRVVDESGEDYLYPVDWFVPIEVPQAVQTSLRRVRRSSSSPPPAAATARG